MANPEQAGEPSMEEILASIRKIISDDDEAAEAGEPSADAGEEAQDQAFEAAESDVFANNTEADDSASETSEGEVEMSEPGTDADVFEASGGADVLALSEAAIVADDDAAEIAITEPVDDDLTFADESEPSQAAPEEHDMAAPPPPVPAPTPKPADNGSMLSASADASVSAAFQNLTSVMLSENARTLDDLVKELMRPMLKSWLDQNLPPLVERLVREEIERVARGSR